MTAVEPEFAERERVAALHDLGVLDRPRRQDLESLARLAAHICDVPTAAVNLIDTDRQWPAAAHGYDPTEVPREASMCTTSIGSRDVSLTPDASADPRWRDNPHVTGELGTIRFYAAAPLVVSAGHVVGTVCVFSETEQELTRAQVERLRDVAELAVRLLELHDEADRLGTAALRDPLTGLPNRTLLVESLCGALARATRTHGAPAVLFLDVDGFKAVNDTHGHAAGDQLLCTLATRLVDTVRGPDLVARIGGDEFVIVCDAVDGRAPDTERIVERVRAAFRRPVALSVGGRVVRVRVGVSIGCAVATGTDTADEVLLRADAAMYRDKQNRRPR